MRLMLLLATLAALVPGPAHGQDVFAGPCGVFEKAFHQRRMAYEDKVLKPNPDLSKIDAHDPRYKPVIDALLDAVEAKAQCWQNLGQTNAQPAR